MENENESRVGGACPIGCVGVYGALLLSLMGAGGGCSEDALLVPDPAVRYLAFGDSETAGESGRDYPQILSELLGQPANAFVNQGRGGETAGEGLQRLRGLLDRGIYPNAHTLLYWQGGADVINLIRQVDALLLLSPTDPSYPHSARLAETLDRVQADIEAAIGAGQGAGLTVYVATYFSLREATARCEPLFLEIILPSQARNANGYVSLLNERIRQAAANTGASLVDIAAADAMLQADDAHFLNCNHLSAAGNAIVARLFADRLRQ